MATDTLYYDGACGLCRASVRTLRALDWLGRLAFADSTTLPPTQLPVPFDMAMQGIPMRTASGRVLVGFQAVRRALLQTPLGALPAALLYLPLLSHTGRAAYRLIATNRRRDCAVNVSTRSSRGTVAPTS